MSWMAAETLAEGPTPEARIGHTSVYDPDSKRIFVFGGSKNKKWFNDVHILDTQSWKWTMVEVCVRLLLRVLVCSQNANDCLQEISECQRQLMARDKKNRKIVVRIPVLAGLQGNHQKLPLSGGGLVE